MKPLSTHQAPRVVDAYIKRSTCILINKLILYSIQVCIIQFRVLSYSVRSKIKNILIIIFNVCLISFNCISNDFPSLYFYYSYYYALVYSLERMYTGNIVNRLAEKFLVHSKGRRR